MKIDRNTWHFRLYDGYTPGDEWDIRAGRVNFCQYSRMVMFGALVATIIALLISLVLIAPLGLIMSSILYFATDGGWMWYFALPNDVSFANWSDICGTLSIFSSVLDIILIILFGFYVVGEYIDGWKRRRAERRREKNAFMPPVKPKEPGFFKTWYFSWKDKYCPMLDMKKD